MLFLTALLFFSFRNSERLREKKALRKRWKKKWWHIGLRQVSTVEVIIPTMAWWKSLGSKMKSSSLQPSPDSSEPSSFPSPNFPAASIYALSCLGSGGCCPSPYRDTVTSLTVPSPCLGGMLGASNHQGCFADEPHCLLLLFFGEAGKPSDGTGDKAASVPLVTAISLFIGGRAEMNHHQFPQKWEKIPVELWSQGAVMNKESDRLTYLMLKAGQWEMWKSCVDQVDKPLWQCLYSVTWQKH